MILALQPQFVVLATAAVAEQTEATVMKAPTYSETTILAEWELLDNKRGDSPFPFRSSPKPPIDRSFLVASLSPKTCNEWFQINREYRVWS